MLESSTPGSSSLPADLKDDVEQRLRLSRIRYAQSPEFVSDRVRWAQSRRRPPSGNPDRDAVRPRLQPNIADFIPLMEARAELVGSKDFQPSGYPGLRPDLGEGVDQGWIAWSILPELRSVLRFAEKSLHSRRDQVRAAVDVAVHLAEQFICKRAAKAGLDDRIRCVHLLPSALSGVGAGKVHLMDRDTAEVERERVNAILRIDSPWSQPSVPPSYATQIVKQMTARGAPPASILKTLEVYGLGGTPEAVAQRSVDAYRAADEGSNAPTTQPVPQSASLKEAADGLRNFDPDDCSAPREQQRAAPSLKVDVPNALSKTKRAPRPPKDLISHESAGSIAECSADTIRRRIEDGTLIGWGDARLVSEAQVRRKKLQIRQRAPRTKRGNKA